MFQTVDDVVDALGATSAIADDLGVNKSFVSTCRARGSIPAANRLLVLELAKKRRVKRITLEVLAELVPRKTAVRA
jgi:hypothetical protein